MTDVLEAAPAEVEAARIDAAPDKTQQERAVDAVTALRSARLEYVKASNHVAKLREEQRLALMEEARALDILKAARLGLKKEAGDE